MSAIKQVREFLNTTNPRRVAVETGLPERWVYKVRNGETKNPGADRFVVLYEYMKQVSSSLTQ